MSYPHDAAQLRRLDHAPALDGLRGVAVLLIVAYHLISVVWPPLLVLEPEVLPGGFLGVDLFFVLSGFLITALLLRDRLDSGYTQFLGFYRGRAMRLLPALSILLAAHVIYAQIVNIPNDVEQESVTSAAFYYLNWKLVWDLRVSEGMGHLWSLSIEEQFYLLWPFAVAALVLLRKWVWAAPVILVGVIGLVMVHRTQLWNDGEPWLFLYVRTDTRADSLLVGALVAFLWVNRKTPTRGLGPAAWVAAVFFAWCVATKPSSDAFFYLGGFTAIALAGAVMLLAALDPNWAANRALRLPPLQAVGRVSYGVYLWHLLVFYAVARWGSDWAPAVRVVVAVVVTALVTTASWFLIERPMLRWKRRLDRRRRDVSHESLEFAQSPAADAARQPRSTVPVASSAAPADRTPD